MKCSHIKNPKQTFHLYKGNWKCDTCLAELPIPFTFTDYNTILDLTFNSSHSPVVKKFNPEITIEDKLKLMLSYSKQSPWYAYTHPHEEDYDFFADDLGESYVAKSNFDYYDVDCFRNRKSLWEKQKTIGLFHTNICSLQANIEQLEDLLHDMDYSFDIIALTETWNPSKSKESFAPKRIEGYLDYLGVEGSSLKGGCGFYIKDIYTQPDFRGPSTWCSYP